MDKELHVFLTQTRDHEPIATLHNLPGPDSDLTPKQMRLLATILNAVANDCEAQPMDKRHFRPTTRSYILVPVLNKRKQGGKMGNITVQDLKQRIADSTTHGINNKPNLIMVLKEFLTSCGANDSAPLDVIFNEDFENTWKVYLKAIGKSPNVQRNHISNLKKIQNIAKHMVISE